jgi:hypothetical protein
VTRNGIIRLTISQAAPAVSASSSADRDGTQQRRPFIFFRKHSSQQLELVILALDIAFLILHTLLIGTHTSSGAVIRTPLPLLRQSIGYTKRWLTPSPHGHATASNTLHHHPTPLQRGRHSAFSALPLLHHRHRHCLLLFLMRGEGNLLVYQSYSYLALALRWRCCP